MEQREANCVHCKGPVQYPMSDVGMPVTCPKCGLSFDAPEGRPARIRPPANLRTICPKCQGLVEYLLEAAGQVIACPGCDVQIKLPLAKPVGPTLEFQDEPESAKKSKTVRRSGPGVVRSKAGFGKELAAMGRSGPRMTNSADPSKNYRIISGIVLLVIGVGIIVGGYLVYQSQTNSPTSRSGKLRQTIKQYIDLLHSESPEQIADFCGATPDTRSGWLREARQKFDEVQITVRTYFIKDAFEVGDLDGTVILRWDYDIRERKSGKSRSFLGEESTLNFRWKDGRWYLANPFVYNRRVGD